MANDEQVVTDVVHVMRLPCGHLVDEPANKATLVCPWDQRTFEVWHKSIELLVREIYP